MKCLSRKLEVDTAPLLDVIDNDVIGIAICKDLNSALAEISHVHDDLRIDVHVRRPKWKSSSYRSGGSSNLQMAPTDVPRQLVGSRQTHGF